MDDKPVLPYSLSVLIQVIYYDNNKKIVTMKSRFMNEPLSRGIERIITLISLAVDGVLGDIYDTFISPPD